MFKIGQRIHVVQDETSPLKSAHTDMVTAWITCGGSCVKGQEYLDTVQTMPDGSQKRRVVWYIDDAIKATFELPDRKEQIDFAEFRSRWMNEEWMEKNADHPICYLKIYRENEKKIRDWIKQQKPAVLIKRNNKTAIIPANCSEAQRNKILAELN